jgi:hypothetical protein
LLVVLHGCETWSLTLKKEHSLRIFEKRVKRKISGPKTDGVKGEWRRLHNGEVHDLYSSPNNIRVIKSVSRNSSPSDKIHRSPWFHLLLLLLLPSWG